MGCDIHSYAEVRGDDGQWHWFKDLFPDAEYEWDRYEVFNWRSYRLFGFLADVRNDGDSPVIAQPRGVPGDISADLLRDKYGEYEGGIDWHSASWLTLAELLAYDYDQPIFHEPLREFLGPGYFGRLDRLAKLGDPDSVRIVFWFDN